MLRGFLFVFLPCASLLSACSPGESKSPNPNEQDDDPTNQADAGHGPTVSDAGADVSGADASDCEPQSCVDLGANCGWVTAGCGEVIDCGTCTLVGESCGFGGTPNVCGKPRTEPCSAALTCRDHGADCGPVADGCGGSLDCGTCSLPQTCGGGGKPSVCGSPSCQTPTIQDLEPPQILVLLDRSGSMKGDNVDRWTPSVASLLSATRTFENRIEFGLMPFPGITTPEPKDCSSLPLFEQLACETENAGWNNASTCAAGSLAVPIGLTKASAFESALAGMVPRGSTPTTETLIEAGKELAKLSAAASNLRQYVLLITDGEPNCGVGVDETVAEIETLAANSVQTFVIGYDITGALVEGMDRMAKAGGTGATKHTAVTTEQSLTQAIAEIERRVNVCELELSEPITRPASLSVEVNGKTLSLNQADGNGFSLESSGRLIRLHGTACTAAGTTPSKVEIRVTCDEPTKL